MTTNLVNSLANTDQKYFACQIRATDNSLIIQSVIEDQVVVVEVSSDPTNTKLIEMLRFIQEAPYEGKYDHQQEDLSGNTKKYFLPILIRPAAVPSLMGNVAVFKFQFVFNDAEELELELNRPEAHYESGALAVTEAGKVLFDAMISVLS